MSVRSTNNYSESKVAAIRWRAVTYTTKILFANAEILYCSHQSLRALVLFVHATMIFRELLLSLLLIVSLEHHESTYISDADWDMYVYPGKAKSARDLLPCKEREVCSIVHNRFWFPRRIESFCRCEIGDCPSIWTDGSDNYTLPLNNRAQLKFCESVTELPACNDTLSLRTENGTTEDGGLQMSSKAECRCPMQNRWVEHQQIRNVESTLIKRRYRCTVLGKCDVDEQCGWERTDNYETYYLCSCPENHMCLRRNRTEYSVNQMFYFGPAYKTVCTKFSNNYSSLHSN